MHIILARPRVRTSLLLAAFFIIGIAMQMYKLITLGQSFVIVNISVFDDETLHGYGDMVKYIPIDEGAKICVKNDMLYDYRAGAYKSDKVRENDLVRVLSIFLYRIKGFPKSEYDIVSLDGNKRIKVPVMNNLYGGNVEKCKLLCSKSAQSDKMRKFESYIIAADKEKFAVVVCDNPQRVDFKKILSVLLTEQPSSESIDGVIALSCGEDGIIAVSKALSGEELFGAQAYAATCYAAQMLFGKTQNKVRIGKYEALCESSQDLVSVFDTAPRVYKIM